MRFYEIFLQATGKIWQKKQLQDKLKSMVKLAKATGDAKRLRIMTGFIKETGNGPAPPPFDETPADDIGLVGRVDPRLLSGTDPVYDRYSLVGVTEGSVFASGQEQSGVGMSQLAPKFAPRFAKDAPATATATVTSGLLAAQVQSTNTAPHESDVILGDLVLDVTHESWAQDILNNSGDGSRNLVIPFSASTPTRSRNDSLNNTFSTANLTPMRVSTPRQIDTSMSPVPSPTIQARRTAAAAVVRPAAAAVVRPAAAAGVPPAAAAGVPPAAAAVVRPAAAAFVPPAAAAGMAPAAAGVAPAAADVVAPAAAAGGAPAAAAGVGPAAANGRAQRRRQRRNNAAPPQPSVSAYEAMLAEKSRINRIVGIEMIRLAKLEKMASFEASREKALYYKLKRELALKKANETLASVDKEYDTSRSIVHTDAILELINRDEGERKGILTVYAFFYYIFVTVKFGFFLSIAVYV
jgi:hypothetical protein